MNKIFQIFTTLLLLTALIVIQCECKRITRVKLKAGAKRTTYISFQTPSLKPLDQSEATTKTTTVAQNRTIITSGGNICMSYTNVHFVGSDFFSANGIQSVDECCSLCSGAYATSCRAWTYEPVSMTCYLKSSIGLRSFSEYYFPKLSY
jgi:hypothetical protein